MRYVTEDEVQWAQDRANERWLDCEGDYNSLVSIVAEELHSILRGERDDQIKQIYS